jgi:hypothetical protein
MRRQSEIKARIRSSGAVDHENIAHGCTNTVMYSYMCEYITAVLETEEGG